MLNLRRGRCLAKALQVFARLRDPKARLIDPGDQLRLGLPKSPASKVLLRVLNYMRV